MYIKHKTSPNRRDFTADYKCEHCGAEDTLSSYDIETLFDGNKEG